ncbi:MAG: hypothetical protein M0Z91_14380 [Actinomycetota bacterium]|nr:hypothetical protein [Actinomycetota bacterium]
MAIVVEAVQIPRLYFRATQVMIFDREGSTKSLAGNPGSTPSASSRYSDTVRGKSGWCPLAITPVR